MGYSSCVLYMRLFRQCDIVTKCKCKDDYDSPACPVHSSNRDRVTVHTLPSVERWENSTDPIGDLEYLSWQYNTSLTKPLNTMLITMTAKLVVYIQHCPHVTSSQEQDQGRTLSVTLCLSTCERQSEDNKSCFGKKWIILCGFQPENNCVTQWIWMKLQFEY